MSAVVERAQQSLELWDRTSGVEITVLTGMVDAEAAYYAAPELVRDLVAEIERIESAAKTLGKIIDDSLWDVAKATDSLDLLDENRDGDWGLIFERLAELLPQRNAAVAENIRLRHQIAGRLRAVGKDLVEHGDGTPHAKIILGHIADEYEAGAL